MHCFSMDLFRRKNKEDQKGFKCEYCNLKFDDKDRMKRHVRKAHSEKGGDMPSSNPFGGF
jgi:uncharacterized C2H2 Zn-finger protein